MTRASVRGELHAARQRTRKALTVSVAAHAALLLLALVWPRPEPPESGLTEITWIDAAEPAATPEPAPVARVERAAPERGDAGLPAPHESKIQFAREEPVAQIEPTPQDATAVRDRMRERLEALRSDTPDRRTQLASLAAPAVASRPVPAGLPEAAPANEPAQLARSERQPSPAALVRTAAPASRPLPVAARISTPVSEPQAAPPPSKSGVSREVLAGITLTGPIADRALLHYARPDYPEWAKTDAVEASVQLYFVVLPDGSVKENVLVQKTSGFHEFDRNAERALLAWHFESLEAGAVGEQWGTITMHYQLGDPAHGPQARRGS